jgi:branched-chain amino acid transport system substrate-binding protein
MPFNRKIVIFIVVALLVIGGYWLSIDSPEQQAGNDARIASILPLTGAMSSFGEQMKRGQELSIELWNEGFLGQNNKAVQITFFDGKGNAGESISAYRQGRLEGIRYFTTTLSPVALALIPIVNQDDVLLFADAAHPSISSSGPNVFRHSSTADQEAEVINERLVELTISSIGIISVNDDYGNAFQSKIVNLFEGNQGKVYESILYNKEEREMRQHVTKIMGNAPDAVIICGVGAAPGIIVRRLKEVGFAGEILATNTFGYPEALKAAGDAANNVQYITFDFKYEEARYKDVNDIYKEKYGEDMGFLAVLEFNTILLLSEAINKTSSISEATKYLKNLGNYDAIGENMQILATGDIRPNLHLVRFNETN